MPTEYTLENLKTDILPIVKRVPSYVKLVVRLEKDPRLSKGDKAKLAGGIAYMASPIDLIPGIIPIVGQLDDLLALLLVLRHVLSSTPHQIVAPYLSETNLTLETIDSDIAVAKRVIKAISATAAKKLGRSLVRMGRFISSKTQEAWRSR